MLRQLARDAGVSMAEFVRRSCLLRPLPKRVSKVTLNTYIELGRIGNNINQLTKAVNTALKLGMQTPAVKSELQALSALLHECRREIADATNGDDADEDTDDTEEEDEENFEGDDD